MGAYSSNLVVHPDEAPRYYLASKSRSLIATEDPFVLPTMMEEVAFVKIVLLGGTIYLPVAVHRSFRVFQTNKYFLTVMDG